MSALTRRGRRESRLGGDSGVQCRPAVFRRRVGNRTERSSGGRVDHVERASTRCVEPFAVDEQSLLDSLDDLRLVMFDHNYPFIVGRFVGRFVGYADC